MTFPEQLPRHRLLAGFLAALALAGALVVIARPAGSQSTVACSGTYAVEFGPGLFNDQSSAVYSQPFPPNGWPTSRTYPVAIPAGRYDLNASSYDGYPNRTNSPPQLREQWFVEFLSANGTVLATSGTTQDLADSVEEAQWSGSIGSVQLAEAATQVRVTHAFIEPFITPNSVSPVCLGVQLACPPGQNLVGDSCQTPTTTTTTTTVPPTTAPPVTTRPPTTTAPTTTVPTEVLPEILLPVTPPARPQVVNPTYTG